MIKKPSIVYELTRSLWLGKVEISDCISFSTYKGTYNLLSVVINDNKGFLRHHQIINPNFIINIKILKELQCK